MKPSLFPFSILIALCTTACGQPQDQNVEKRLSDLEKRVAALEQAPPLSSLLNAQSPPPAVTTKSPLQLVSWAAHLGPGQDNDYHYTITLTLKNTGNKDIKLIDATVQFAGSRGSHIYGMKVNSDRYITAGDSATESREYSVNELMPEARLAQMKKEDVKATLVVSKLVFSDNSIGEYAP